MSTREELVKAFVKSRDIFNAAIARGSLADAGDAWADVKEDKAALIAYDKVLLDIDAQIEANPELVTPADEWQLDRLDELLKENT